MKRKYEVTSHENFDHDAVRSVGFDWDFAADPEIAPRRPLRLYLPETTEEVAAAIREARRLGIQPADIRVRSKGHSSNHLVLGDRAGVTIWTEFLDGVERPVDDWVWVQAGAVLAQVDAGLEERKRGLPVIGDHNHITAGGFASVGGVSPASNEHGMFIDNVYELEWVDWDGHVRRCSPTQDAPTFRALLGGLGRDGVITRLRCRVIEAEKTRDLLENDREIVWGDVEAFIAVSAERIRSSDRFAMERGLWLDYPLLSRPGSPSVRVGQYSSYRAVDRTPLRALRNRLAHGWLHAIGYLAGRPSLFFRWRPLRWLGRLLDQGLQLAAVLLPPGIIFAPRYASTKNVESFADRVLDSSVGDPSRLLIVFTRVESYERVFRALHELCLRYRGMGCLSFVTIYVKRIDSAYLKRAVGDESARFCELLLYVGVRPSEMEKRLDALVREIDELCGACPDTMRYMHTRTVGPDDPLRSIIDPNERVRRAEAQAEVA